jgi:hypothetical protein
LKVFDNTVVGEWISLEIAYSSGYSSARMAEPAGKNWGGGRGGGLLLLLLLLVFLVLPLSLRAVVGGGWRGGGEEALWWWWWCCRGYLWHEVWVRCKEEVE